MTTVIDHAIAIPTRPANVWDIVRDISKNPIWHPDSQRVQFLTTNKQGRGTRWRNTTPAGKEQVYEITAWYDGLGYEYRIVDGSNYPNNRGRIRLQEAPEGTVLQWTFSYEVGGMLGQLRNRLSMRGQADKKVVQGLRTIYSYVKDLKADEILSPEESKSYLKEAPDVEARANYQPRYPSKVPSEQIPTVTQEIPSSDEDAPFKPPVQVNTPVASAPIIDEPPIADDDTKPNPKVQPPAEETFAPPSAPAEPDFLKTMPDPIPQTRKPQEIEPVVEPELPQTTNFEQETVESPVTDIDSDYSEPIVPSPAEPTVPSAKAEESPLEPLTNQKTETDTEPMIESSDLSKLDTSQISVFDLFGLEKPSETQKMQAMQDEMPATAEPEVTNDDATVASTLPETSAPESTSTEVTVTNAISEPEETSAEVTIADTTEEKPAPEARTAFMSSTPIVPDVKPEIPQQRRGLRAALRRSQMKLRLPK